MSSYDLVLKMNFGYFIMPIIVFGNSSSSFDNGNKTDATIFVQKPYLRSNYNEANIEEDIHMKNQSTIKILVCP